MGLIQNTKTAVPVIRQEKMLLCSYEHQLR